LSSEPAERRLAAILSADVAGYTRLMATDEDATVRRLAAYREEVALLVRQQRGRLVDFTGDNFSRIKRLQGDLPDVSTTYAGAPAAGGGPCTAGPAVLRRFAAQV